MARRSLRPLELSKGTMRPHGARWAEWTRQLRMAWWRSGRKCFYCNHHFLAPELIEVAHLASPLIRPDLAWSRDNLVPAHGPRKKTVNKRCPVPECQLNCNYLAAVAPDARKDENGFDMPFSPEFIARQATRNGRSRACPGNSGESGAIPAPSAVSPGRPW